MTGFQKGGQQVQDFRQGVLQHIVPGFGEIMTLRGGKTPSPFFIE
jgi:hypothetical protein